MEKTKNTSETTQNTRKKAQIRWNEKKKKKPTRKGIIKWTDFYPLRDLYNVCF